MTCAAANRNLTVVEDEDLGMTRTPLTQGIWDPADVSCVGPSDVKSAKWSTPVWHGDCSMPQRQNLLRGGPRLSSCGRIEAELVCLGLFNSVEASSSSFFLAMV